MAPTVKALLAPREKYYIKLPMAICGRQLCWYFCVKWQRLCTCYDHCFPKSLHPLTLCTPWIPLPKAPFQAPPLHITSPYSPQDGGKELKFAPSHSLLSSTFSNFSPFARRAHGWVSSSPPAKSCLKSASGPGTARLAHRAEGWPLRSRDPWLISKGRLASRSGGGRPRRARRPPRGSSTGPGRHGR